VIVSEILPPDDNGGAVNKTSSCAGVGPVNLRDKINKGQAYSPWKPMNEIQVIEAFAAVGVIILLGFLGSLLFYKTKIPDIVLLIFLGVLIGPHVLGLTSPDVMHAVEVFSPLFMAIALVIILFDGGLNLNYQNVLDTIGKATMFTVLNFVTFVGLATVVAYYFLGITNWTIAMLLGAILGGTSSAIVIPIVSKMSIGEDAKNLLILESVITDVLVIVTVVSMVHIMLTNTTDMTVASSSLANAFLVAMVVGFLFGIFWLKSLKVLKGKPFSFMITLAILFILYALVEGALHSSGAIAALIFGLVLGNKDEFARIFKKSPEDFVFDEHIKQFHSEMSFMVKTFFFVYLGIIFNLNALASFPIMIASLSLFAVVVLARYPIAKAVGRVAHMTPRETEATFIMFPRGLSAAVLATYPYMMLRNSPVWDTLNQHTQDFLQNDIVNVVFVVLVLTAVAASVGTIIIERRTPEDEKQKEEETDIDPTTMWYQTHAPTVRKRKAVRDKESKPHATPSKVKEVSTRKEYKKADKIKKPPSAEKTAKKAEPVPKDKKSSLPKRTPKRSKKSGAEKQPKKRN